MVSQMSDNPTPEQEKAELAAIHLGANPPRFDDARLAIDALAAIVDALGSRLGQDHETFKDALANIRLVYVKLTTENN